MRILSAMTVVAALWLLIKILKDNNPKIIKIIFSLLCIMFILPYGIIFADSLIAEKKTIGEYNIISGDLRASDRYLKIYNTETGEYLYGPGGIADYTTKTAKGKITVVYTGHLKLIDCIYKTHGQYNIYIYRSWVYLGIPLVLFICLFITYKFITGITNDIYFIYEWKFYKGTWGSGESAFDNVKSGIVVKEDYK